MSNSPREAKYEEDEQQAPLVEDSIAGITNNPLHTFVEYIDMTKRYIDGVQDVRLAVERFDKFFPQSEADLDNPSTEWWVNKSVEITASDANIVIGLHEYSSGRTLGFAYRGHITRQMPEQPEGCMYVAMLV